MASFPFQSYHSFELKKKRNWNANEAINFIMGYSSEIKANLLAYSKRNVIPMQNNTMQNWTWSLYNNGGNIGGSDTTFSCFKKKTELNKNFCIHMLLAKLLLMCLKMFNADWWCLSFHQWPNNVNFFVVAKEHAELEIVASSSFR